MPAVFDIELAVPLAQKLRYATLIADFGDGFEQRANKNLAFTHANGEGGATSYRGINGFTITVDMLQHINGDVTAAKNKLWNFYKARLGSYEAFYFYNPAEAPTPDLSGSSTTGRYLVRFADAELDLNNPNLNYWNGSLSLVEVRS